MEFPKGEEGKGQKEYLKKQGKNHVKLYLKLLICTSERLHAFQEG